MATDTVHHIVKDAFHEMVAGIQKQPYYPSVKKPKSSITASQKRARKLADQASSQSAGSGSMSYSASAGKKKRSIDRQVASQTAGTAPRKKGTTTATTVAGRSIQRVEDKKKDLQRQEKLRQKLQSPDYRAEVQRQARKRGMAYDDAITELQGIAKDPNRYRKIADQVESAERGEGRKLTNFLVNEPKLVRPIYTAPKAKPKVGGFGGKDRFSRYLSGLVGKKMQKAIRSWAEGVLSNG